MDPAEAPPGPGVRVVYQTEKRDVKGEKGRVTGLHCVPVVID